MRSLLPASLAGNRKQSASAADDHACHEVNAMYMWEVPLPCVTQFTSHDLTPPICPCVTPCSFPSLSCEFATLDVSDALGTKRFNLTKTLRKTAIAANMERVGAATDDVARPMPKYDEEGAIVSGEAGGERY